jgi:hypothetical protein
MGRQDADRCARAHRDGGPGRRRRARCGGRASPGWPCRSWADDAGPVRGGLLGPRRRSAEPASPGAPSRSIRGVARWPSACCRVFSAVARNRMYGPRSRTGGDRRAEPRGAVRLREDQGNESPTARHAGRPAYVRRRKVS